MSASNDTQSKDDGLKSGMDYFLFKPFNYEDLVLIFRTKTDNHSKSDVFSPPSHIIESSKRCSRKGPSFEARFKELKKNLLLY